MVRHQLGLVGTIEYRGMWRRFYVNASLPITGVANAINGAPVKFSSGNSISIFCIFNGALSFPGRYQRIGDTCVKQRLQNFIGKKPTVDIDSADVRILFQCAPSNWSSSRCAPRERPNSRPALATRKLLSFWRTGTSLCAGRTASSLDVTLGNGRIKSK